MKKLLLLTLIAASGCATGQSYEEWNKVFWAKQHAKQDAILAARAAENKIKYEAESKAIADQIEVAKRLGPKAMRDLADDMRWEREVNDRYDRITQQPPQAAYPGAGTCIKAYAMGLFLPGCD